MSGSGGWAERFCSQDTSIFTAISRPPSSSCSSRASDAFSFSDSCCRWLESADSSAVRRRTRRSSSSFSLASCSVSSARRRAWRAQQRRRETISSAILSSYHAAHQRARHQLQTRGARELAMSDRVALHVAQLGTPPRESRSWCGCRDRYAPAPVACSRPLRAVELPAMRRARPAWRRPARADDAPCRAGRRSPADGSLSRNRLAELIEGRLDSIARRLIGLQVLVVGGQQDSALAGLGIGQLGRAIPPAAPGAAAKD